MENQKLLILGANGFLGSTIFEKAKQSGKFDVSGTSRNGTADWKLDVTSRQELQDTLLEIQPNIIIWTLMDQENEGMLIENGLKHLLEIMPKETKLLYLSTDAFFTGENGGFKESAALDLAIFHSARISSYARAKLKGEYLIREQHSNHIIVRTGPLYGKAGNHRIEKRTEKILKQIKNHTSCTIPSNWIKTFAHVEDVADAMIELCLLDYQGTIHLGPDAKDSYYSFYQKRIKQLGYKLEKLYQVLDDHPHDTSLDTQLAHSMLKTDFREL